MNRLQEIKDEIDLIKILFLIGFCISHMYAFLPSTASMLFVNVILLCKLLSIKLQIRRLSAADLEPSSSLTVTFTETFLICMYVYVRSLH